MSESEGSLVQLDRVVAGDLLYFDYYVFPNTGRAEGRHYMFVLEAPSRAIECGYPGGFVCAVSTSRSRERSLRLADSYPPYIDAARSSVPIDSFQEVPFSVFDPREQARYRLRVFGHLSDRDKKAFAGFTEIFAPDATTKSYLWRATRPALRDWGRLP